MTYYLAYELYYTKPSFPNANCSTILPLKNSIFVPFTDGKSQTNSNRITQLSEKPIVLSYAFWQGRKQGSYVSQFSIVHFSAKKVQRLRNLGAWTNWFELFLVGCFLYSIVNSKKQQEVFVQR